MLRTVPALWCVVAACSSSVSPRTDEQWAADLTATRQLLVIQFTRSGSSVNGTGSLSNTLVPGSTEPLRVGGSRRADTLELVLTRPDGDIYRFSGWYVARGSGLSGTLSGGAFTDTPVSFRQR